MRSSHVLSKVSSELGIATVLASPRDVHTLLLTRCVRMFAYGSSTLVLAIYFESLGFSDTRIGLFLTLTLVGDVLISLALTLVADALGRRRILTLGALLMAASGTVFASFSNYWILLLAAIIGVISPSGNEIGPFRAVEESTLAHLTDARTRSDVFAWYVVFGTVGTAGGALIGGWITQGLQAHGWTQTSSFRVIFWMYAVIGLAKAALTMLLSDKCEMKPAPARQPEEGEEMEPFLGDSNGARNPPSPRRKSMLAQISRRSWGILAKLCMLFFFDSLASGMMPYSLIVLYLKRKFGIGQGELGTIMSVAQFLSAIGNVFASSLAKRIGPVKTMVFTHLPSAVLLGLIPMPSSLALTIVILGLRFSLASMDQAARSAFLSAVVLPDERTATMGIVNTVKTMSQSAGPTITGSLAEAGYFWIAFVIAGSLKVGYDLGLLSQFVNMKLEGDVGHNTAQRETDEEAHADTNSPLTSDELHDSRQRA